MVIPSWAGGLDAALDVTVVNPLQSATLAEAAVNTGHAFNVWYASKMSGDAVACQREGIKFLPLVIQTLGGWYREQEVRKLGDAKGRHSSQEEDEADRHAFTQLSILLQRVNAAILSNQIPVG